MEPTVSQLPASKIAYLSNYSNPEKTEKSTVTHVTPKFEKLSLSANFRELQ